MYFLTHLSTRTTTHLSNHLTSPAHSPAHTPNKSPALTPDRSPVHCRYNVSCSHHFRSSRGRSSAPVHDEIVRRRGPHRSSSEIACAKITGRPLSVKVCLVHLSVCMSVSLFSSLSHPHSVSPPPMSFSLSVALSPVVLRMSPAVKVKKKKRKKTIFLQAPPSPALARSTAVHSWTSQHKATFHWTETISCLLAPPTGAWRKCVALFPLCKVNIQYYTSCKPACVLRCVSPNAGSLL